MVRTMGGGRQASRQAGSPPALRPPSRFLACPSRDGRRGCRPRPPMRHLRERERERERERKREKERERESQSKSVRATESQKEPQRETDRLSGARSRLGHEPSSPQRHRARTNLRPARTFQCCKEKMSARGEARVRRAVDLERVVRERALVAVDEEASEGEVKLLVPAPPHNMINGVNRQSFESQPN